ncbi:MULTISPECIES: succinylglutamate desuccinylase [Aliivibrio]|uniref:Succinylglutamate desuccinylase n=1 Tax=Aliivibrio finisterrensis TaxID=511998 RepID=A0A4V1Z8J5_9GAMM|nr:MULTISPECIES: succinylglutamate desuccinylase [Aliivibrio]MDD9178768.1 succinylglutamate desuccinylase [Aliivibrio sp. A6]RYU49606.1 succinylglutamate desuccinylase [Aliivibrio finisterrensis]RYU50217.1 succinylglutamate desuccinylase [Aliivibrio finisterrensis]RYU55942.1 succinylglutamate desuccinylase [Aliivibrio finisterrensis]RYU62255.1 succinylglutamate desuccinylase [Aliivibrio finisterrensis]
MDHISFIQNTLDLSVSVKEKSWLLTDGTLVIYHSRGVVEFVPSLDFTSNRAVVLSSGVHGNETSPIELLDTIIEDIQSGKLSLTQPCLFIYGHPAATHQHTRFIDTNLNRLFSGYQTPDDSVVEVALANRLMESVDRFFTKHDAQEKWHLDLHCAIRSSQHYTFAIHPYNRHYKRSDPLLRFLSQSKIEACLFSEAPASTFSWYSAEHHGAHAATVELGKVAKMGENDLTLLADFEKELRHFISHDSHTDNEKVISSVIEYQVTRSIMKHSEQFEFHFPSDLANFTQFNENELLAEDEGVKYRAQRGGESVVFPNAKVENGHRACLLVQKIEN